MDDAAFDDLVRRHSAAVTAYASAVARDRWAAEEAVQETFLRAWKYLDSFHGSGSFEGWLIRICRRCIIDQAARFAPEERIDIHGSSYASPSAAGLTETRDLVRSLPLPQRECLVLCSVIGYEYEEVAALLNVPIGTVRSRVHRARSTLQEMLAASRRDSA